MAAPDQGEDDTANLDSESDGESFVDALEDLQLMDEKPVEFKETRDSLQQNLDTSEHSSANSDVNTGTITDDMPRMNSDVKLTPSSETDSDQNSSSEEEERERTIDDLIKEATSEPSGEAESPSQCHEDDTEADADADEAERKEAEAAMTEEEKQAKREEAQAKKVEGNERFKAENYQGALESYTEALFLCPLEFSKDRSIMFSNRAASKYKLERYESAIDDCTKALELNPVYLKALLRRAELYEKTDKLDEALADYTKALEMDKTLVKARIACQTLPDRIKERNEKLKEEMLEKLKDLGNLILRPFGLSTNNFKLQKDPNTGSYSVQFQQGQPPPDPSNGK